jgi:GNAT superfamily N-acetyltransferase
MQIECKEISFLEMSEFFRHHDAGVDISEEYLHPQALTAGAFADGKLCGVIVCQREDRPGEGHFGTFRILKIFVASSMRGSGISQLLLLRAAAYAKRYKGKYLWLTAPPEFTTYIRKCGFYDELSDNDIAVSEIVFIREISSF